MTDKDVGTSGYERFALELEFVQCLANPLYLNCERAWGGGARAAAGGRIGDRPRRTGTGAAGLPTHTPGRSLAAAGLATKQYFENPAFINYLKYLTYWKQPAYAKHIT